MVQPVEELNQALASFVEQEEKYVLLLTTYTEEIPLVVHALDTLDGESPDDVFFTDITPVRNAWQYADDVVRNAWAQLSEVNTQRKAEGKPPLAEIPPVCFSREVTPAQRIAALIKHMVSWVPSVEENRLVVSLLPAEIEDQEAHAHILGSIVPFGALEPWMRGLRLTIRDDSANPFAENALHRAGVRGVLLYQTRVTVAGIADAVAREAEDPSLPPVRRINALLQCATFDVAMGRYEAAIDKYGTLYTYYDEFHVHEMRAVVVQGLGDVMLRLGRLPAAREKYMQALDIASDAKSVPLIMNISASLGDVDYHMQAYAEAAKSYALGASAAEKLGNVVLRADLLEKCGIAHGMLGDLNGAGQAWTGAAVVAREAGYDARLATVLDRLRELSSQGGYHDIAADYERELRDVRARVG